MQYKFLYFSLLMIERCNNLFLHLTLTLAVDVLQILKYVLEKYLKNKWVHTRGVDVSTKWVGYSAILKLLTYLFAFGHCFLILFDLHDVQWTQRFHFFCHFRKYPSINLLRNVNLKKNEVPQFFFFINNTPLGRETFFG